MTSKFGRKVRYLVLATALGSGSAFAQALPNASPSDPASPPAKQDEAAASQASTHASPSTAVHSDAETGIGEIVVTAQRREQRQQDVPIAISTVTGQMAQKAGVVGTESLSIAVPGLQFTRQIANGGAPFLRGVGSTQAQAGFESPVATYIDDVYIGAPGAALMAFNNIDRIEVLKGPQGTLFGRNATGGVINVHTLQPSDTFRLDAKAGYANYQTTDGSLYVTGPLSDTLSANFAAVGHDQANGYGRDATTGQDVYKDKFYGTRAEVLWKPGPDTRVLLIGDYSWDKGDAGLNVALYPGTKGVGGAAYEGKYVTTNSPADGSKTEGYGFSGRLDQGLGELNLVSISAYRANDVYIHMDNDSTALAILGKTSHIRNRTFSQEVQLQAPKSARLQWILGAFYYHSSAGLQPLDFKGSAQAANGGEQRIVDTAKVDSYSAFAEANYEIFDATKITAGIRYTSDHLGNDVVVYNATATPVAPGPFTQSDQFSKVTYRAVLDHHFAQNVMAYASYSRGFKSGGYNETAPILTTGGVSRPAPVVSPEVIDAYEAGLKTEWFDHKLRLNAAAFYYNYQNLQVTTVGLGTSTVLNAAKAHIKGVDFDFDAAPISRVRITGGASFLDSKFASFPNGPYTVLNPATCGTTPHTTGPVTGGSTTCSFDLTGFRTPRAPKFTGSLSGTYTLPTTSGDYALTGSLYRNDGFFWEADNRLTQPAYTIVNASLTWTSPNGKFDVSVWGKNLANAYYYTYSSASALRDSGSPAMPRTYGVSAGVHFR